MQNEKISAFQFFVLVVFFTVGTSILYIPSSLSDLVKQDAWVSAIIGTLIGLLVIWLFTYIGSRFPKLTYTQLNQKVFGKIIGSFFSICLVFMCILYTAALLSHLGVFLITQMFPQTPMVALNVLMAIVLVMAVYLGIETIARSAEILIFIFFFLFIILVLTILPQMDTINLRPFFQAGMGKLLHSSISLIVVSSVNAIVLLMIFPAFITDMKKAKKNFFIGYLIGGIIVIITILLCILILGPITTARQVYPSYSLAKVINVGNFITRIESLMASLWILGLFYKAVLYFYAAILGITQIFRLKSNRSLIYPLAIIIVFISVNLFPNILYKQMFDSQIGIALSIIIGLFLPIILLLVYWIRRKKLMKDPEHAKTSLEGNSS